MQPRSRFDKLTTNGEVVHHASAILAFSTASISISSMAKPIDYVWRCRKCAAENPPHLEACGRCGFPAIAVGSKTNDDSISPPIFAALSARRNRAFTLELWVATGIVLAAPVWCLELLFTGRTLAAGLLFLGTAVGAPLMWVGYRRDSPLFLIVGIVAVIGGAFATLSH